MAVDTFLKICNKCKRKFVIQQPMEREPFITELLGMLQTTMKDLEMHQINVFYESTALMISAESDVNQRNLYLVCFHASLCPCCGHLLFSTMNYCVPMYQLSHPNNCQHFL